MRAIAINGSPRTGGNTEIMLTPASRPQSSPRARPWGCSRTRIRIGRVQLEQGDILVGYTDGVTDARSPLDELLMRSRLKTILAKPFAAASELIEGVELSVFRFIDDVAPHDDGVTLLACSARAGSFWYD